MKKLILGAVAATATMASPAMAQDNYLFGFSTNGGELVLNTTDGDVTINATDSGWYFENGNHSATNNNYIVGTCTSCVLSGMYNDYFTFDLSSVTGTITGATFQAFNPDYVSGVLSTWSVWDVTTDIAQLDVTRPSNDMIGQDIFNDLQSGTLFGSRTITNVTDGTTVGVALNADALTNLNNAVGGNWAIGGTLREGFVIPGAVPEPATWAMMLLGFFAVGGAMRRQGGPRVSTRVRYT